MSYLIIVYLGLQGVPDVKIHEVPKTECNALAKKIYNNVKAGQVRAFCLRHRSYE